MQLHIPIKEINLNTNDSSNLFHFKSKISNPNITTVPNLINNIPTSFTEKNFYKTDTFKINKNLFYTSSQNLNNNNQDNFATNSNNNTGTNFYNSAKNFGNQNFNTTNGNNTINFLKNQNEELFNLIESMKSEEIQLKAAYTNLKDKYLKLNYDKEELQESHAKYKSEFEELMKMKNFVEEKMKENNNQIIINESKIISIETENETLKIKNSNLKERLNYYKEQYDDLEKRKNQEIEVAYHENKELRDHEVNFKIKYSLLEEEHQNLKFDLNRFKNENAVLRFDLDHLTKVIDESNLTVKSAIEKEKNLDSILKNHKKKVEEANIEKEKCFVKQKLLEKQIIKLTDENMKFVMEKQTNFDEQIENTKSKFNQILSLKDDELANLKAELFATKIEKDKYFTDFIILKKESEKFSKSFSEELEKYIKHYEETEKNAIHKEKELNDKIGDLSKKYEQSEFIKNNLQKENEIFRNSENERKNAFEKANRNDEFKTREINKFKEKFEISTKENENLNKELQKAHISFNHKIEQITEKHSLEIKILEDSINYQKTQFDVGQAKAFEMIKKQENVKVLVCIFKTLLFLKNYLFYYF